MPSYVSKGIQKTLTFSRIAWSVGNGEFKVFANEFKVDNYYRFEGPSDPGDQSIVYAISSDVHDIKGVLVNAYGIYSEPITDKMLKRLEMRKPGTASTE